MGEVVQRDAKQLLPAALPKYASVPPLQARRRPDYERLRQAPLGQAILRAAQRVYSQALQESTKAQAYLTQRGISLDLAIRCGLGYCTGDQLAHELKRRGISQHAAGEVGMLVEREERERFAGRITIPEIRQRHLIWMTGRIIDEEDKGRPRYLSLPGPPPVVGKMAIRGQQPFMVTRSIFDWLTLRQWEFPAIAFPGGSLATGDLENLQGELGNEMDIYLAFDRAAASQGLAVKLARLLGKRTRIIELPADVKDVNELGQKPEGKEHFLACMQWAAPGS